MSLKSSLSKDKAMDGAVEIHREMVAREWRGPGDLEATMYRLQDKFGLDYWQQWQLRYRRSAGSEFKERLRQAYLTMLERSVRTNLEKLRTEQTVENAGADTESLILEGQAFLAKIQAKKVST